MMICDIRDEACRKTASGDRVGTQLDARAIREIGSAAGVFQAEEATNRHKGAEAWDSQGCDDESGAGARLARGPVARGTARGGQQRGLNSVLIVAAGALGAKAGAQGGNGAASGKLRCTGWEDCEAEAGAGGRAARARRTAGCIESLGATQWFSA